MFRIKSLLLIFIALLPVTLLAFTVPAKPKTLVNDYAGMLSAGEISALETKLDSFANTNGAQIAVVTIPALDGDTIENVAQEIFTAWGIGQKDKNNGVLLLISLADRKTRIQTGYGVEGDLTDVGTSYIQSDVITPAFRSGDYYGGIDGAVDKMIAALGGSNIVPQPSSFSNFLNNNSNNLGWIFVSVIIAFQWLMAILARSKSWWGGGVVGGVVGIALWYSFISSVLIGGFVFLLLVGFGLLLDFFASRAYHNHKDGGPRPPWFLGGGMSGGSSGSSFGGGGFGGFGGGGSGGGGSSGGW